MNLYLISQDVNTGYDTFDSAVVAAESEEAARNTFPHFGRGLCEHPRWVKHYGEWAASPDQVKAELIGTAVEGTQPGCICASYNAG